MASTPQKLRADAKKMRAEADVHERRAQEFGDKASKYAEDSFETGMKNVWLKRERRELEAECRKLRSDADSARHNAEAYESEARSAKDFDTANDARIRAESYREAAAKYADQAERAEQRWRDAGKEIEANEYEAAKLSVQAETARRIQADELDAAQELDATAKTMEDAAYRIEHPKQPQKLSELDDDDVAGKVASADALDDVAVDPGTVADAIDDAGPPKLVDDDESVVEPAEAVAIASVVAAPAEPSVATLDEIAADDGAPDPVAAFDDRAALGQREEIAAYAPEVEPDADPQGGDELADTGVDEA